MSDKDKKANLKGQIDKKKPVGLTPSFRIPNTITGKGKTTFGASMRNLAFLGSFVVALLFILLSGYWISKPKPSLVTEKAIEISKRVADIPEPGLGDISSYGESSLAEGEFNELLVKTFSDQAAEEEEKKAHLARLAAAASGAIEGKDAADESAKTAAAMEARKREMEEERRRDAFGLMGGVKKAVDKMKKSTFKPTVIPGMRSGATVGGIKVPGGASTAAAFKFKAIGRAKKGADGVSAAPSKNYMVKGGLRVAPLSGDYYRTTGKAEAAKDAVIKSGKTMGLKDAIKAGEATLETLKGAPAGTPAQILAAGKSGYGGGGGGYKAARGYPGFRPRSLREELIIMRATKELEHELAMDLKNLELQFAEKQMWSDLLKEVIMGIAKEVLVPAFVKPPGALLSGFMNKMLGTAAGPPTWLCIMPDPSRAKGCRCDGPGIKGKAGDPNITSWHTQCLAGRGRGIQKDSICLTMCP